MAVASVGHSIGSTNFCAGTVSQKVYDLARAGTLKLPGFPDFGAAVAELKTHAPPPQPPYSVTLPVGDAWIVKEALIEQWLEKADFASDMKELLVSHNKEFNPKGIKRSSESTPGPERAAKKLCLEHGALTVDEFETKYTERTEAQMLQS